MMERTGMVLTAFETMAESLALAARASRWLHFFGQADVEPGFRSVELCPYLWHDLYGSGRYRGPDCWTCVGELCTTSFDFGGVPLVHTAPVQLLAMTLAASGEYLVSRGEFGTPLELRNATGQVCAKVETGETC